ncbi:hypothetical protein C9I28_08885 [Pseudoduganella armeniaca]|uniref:Uncharacterized protein n=1 Tax=Pseudoduganella armeniaca TaxID=2072590 RepID=A0A2R4C881_9BURK|nr:hypothetical protein C9I28_08885 [Pseudoduganella armeniaca]
MSSLVLKAVSAAVLSLATCAVSAATIDPNCPNCFAKRWVYFAGNLAVADQVAALKTLIADAKANGFNGIAVNSGGYGSFTQLLANPTSQNMVNLDRNLKDVLAVAKLQGIELIPVSGGPEVPAVIYPELTEALPASATYVVDNGYATIAPTAVATEGRSMPRAAGKWTWDRTRTIPTSPSIRTKATWTSAPTSSVRSSWCRPAWSGRETSAAI